MLTELGVTPGGGLIPPKIMALLFIAVMELSGIWMCYKCSKRGEYKCSRGKVRPKKLDPGKQHVVYGCRALDAEGIITSRGKVHAVMFQGCKS